MLTLDLLIRSEPVVYFSVFFVLLWRLDYILTKVQLILYAQLVKCCWVFTERFGPNFYK